MTGRIRGCIATLVLAVLMAACGSSGGDDTSIAASDDSNGDDFPLTVDADNGPVTISERPGAIVSLSPSITEMIYAVGGGEQVIAVDKSSNFPDGTPMTELSGFRPNIESIGTLEPDLVFVARDADGIVSTLEDVGIPVVLLEAADNLTDVYRQIEIVGTVTGNEQAGLALSAEVESAIDELTQRVPMRSEPLTYFYELSDSYGTVTSDTFVGSVFALAGLVNIADDVDPTAGSYPQLTAEYVLGSDPDFIFVGHGSGPAPTVEEISARSGWSELTAVAEGRVVVLDSDIASRWGPRVVELFATVLDAIDAAG